MPRISPYASRIRATIGPSPIDVRHVEAYMRAENSVLDALSSDQFDDEAKFCVTCVLMSGPEAAERLARSFGL